MNEPAFRLNQRVYNRANPYHGKVVEIFPCEGRWCYRVCLDQPNPTKEAEAVYFEEGLRATLEEAVAWQRQEHRAWICPFCATENASHLQGCFKCGMPCPVDLDEGR